MASLAAAHEHKLFFLDTTKIFSTKGIPSWSCDACKRTSQEMQVTHSYRCMSCNVDICEECSEPISTNTHAHRMVVTDAQKVYPDGMWRCDNCSADYTSQGG